MHFIIYILFPLLMLVSNLLQAQTDQQTSINFKGRIYTISKDSSGNWMIPEKLNNNLSMPDEKEQVKDSLLVQALHLLLKKPE